MLSTVQLKSNVGGGVRGYDLLPILPNSSTAATLLRMTIVLFGKGECDDSGIAHILEVPSD